MSRYTKFHHIATPGTKLPALCGKLPPGGRDWKPAPEGLPPCQKCQEALMLSSMALAS